MPKKITRWGVIGCGNVTERKSVPAYQKTQGFEVAAVMCRNAAKAADYAQRHGIDVWTTDADEIINSEQIDAVYIATPPDSHLYYSLKVAESGKPCCIEKPMAPSFEECVMIEKAFNECRLPLFIAYYRRSLPRFKQVKQWIDDDKIGQVRHISWQLSKPPGAVDLSGAENWRTQPEVAPGGYFDDLASHGLDLFTYLLGDIELAKGICTNQQGLYKAKDAVTAIWQHKSGVTGSGCWNFGCAVRQDTVEILGAKGKIVFSIFDEVVLRLKNDEGEQTLLIDNPPNIQLYHVANIRDALDGKSPHPSTGASGAHTAWVMGQVLRVV